MRTLSQSRSLAGPPPVSGAGGRGRLPGSEGMMTRARRRRLGLADPLVPCAGSGGPRKRPRLGFAHPLRPCTVARLPGGAQHGAQRSLAPHPLDPSTDARPFGHPDVTEWRDWANLTTELIEDIAGRLLSLDVAEYLRLRTVCKPWRDFTDDPRARGGLDSRFRPRHWMVLPACSSTSRYDLCNFSTGACAAVDLQEVSTHHRFGGANGLLVLCDKATYAVRLFNPLTRMLTEFPAITKVRAYDDAEPNARLTMEALKVRFPNPFVISDFAGIDDSTSPPTLVLCLRNGSWHIICAKPGDQHWVSVHPRELRGIALTMFRYVNVGVRAAALHY